MQLTVSASVSGEHLHRKFSERAPTEGASWAHGLAIHHQQARQTRIRVPAWVHYGSSYHIVPPTETDLAFLKHEHCFKRCCKCSMHYSWLDTPSQANHTTS